MKAKQKVQQQELQIQKEKLRKQKVPAFRCEHINHLKHKLQQKEKQLEPRTRLFLEYNKS